MKAIENDQKRHDLDMEGKRISEEVYKLITENITDFGLGNLGYIISRGLGIDDF